MDNLITPSKYEPAPIANSSTQKGGRGKNHKRNCKCPLCKKKGGSYIEEDIETGTVSKEEGKTEEDKNVKNDLIFAEDNDYDDLDAAEKGQAGPFKVGGTRKRKYKKSKKCRKCRKTRRRKHKTHRRR